MHILQVNKENYYKTFY